LACRRADNREIPVEISASIATIGGRDHILAFVRDTTERDRQRAGIADARKADLFEHQHRGLDSEGLGLGPSLVSTLVDAYGGDISVVDNDPRGTAFEVRFRRADAEGATRGDDTPGHE